MMDNQQMETSNDATDQQRLMQMVTGFWVSRIVYLAAKLGIADCLAEGPRRATDIAQHLSITPRNTYRLMRALGSLGLLRESSDGHFSLTSLGEALRTDVNRSARNAVLAMCSDWMWQSWEQLPYAFATGETGMSKAFGMELFDYLAANPEEATRFSAAMVQFHGPETPAVAEAWNFSDYATVVDVGGATGNMLCAILERHAGVRGLLFDRPHVVSEAPKLIAARGLSGRIDIAEGNFFESVPTGGDVYLLSHIIHDWSEQQCMTILGNCRAAMHDNARLLIIEMVLPAGDTPHPGKLTDIMMLVGPGGEERSADEYAELLGKAGFRLERVVPTTSAASIVEAVPA